MACESDDLGAGGKADKPDGSRRDFLKKAAMLPAALVASQSDSAAAPKQPPNRPAGPGPKADAKWMAALRDRG